MGNHERRGQSCGVPHARDYRPVMAKGGDKGRMARIGGLSWSLVELAGGWAETSERLSAEERAELARLNKQARDARNPLTGGRAREVHLARRQSGRDRAHPG